MGRLGRSKGLVPGRKELEEVRPEKTTREVETS